VSLPLLFHIITGTVALGAGAGALAVRKGSRRHAQVGTAFFIAMLAMAGSGAAIAALLPERGTAVIGVFTCYLVATSWATARRRDGRAGRFELGGLVVAIAAAGTLLLFGLQALASPNRLVDSLPPEPHFGFAALAAIAAVLDANHIVRQKLTPAQRIARHLWRMTMALAIAASSFFLGQQDEFPAVIQGSPLLFLPPLAALLAMLYWMVRTRWPAFGHRRRAPRDAVPNET
jgi:uncharacterized membrane protein